MKHECDIVRDLMPLYVDGTASEKSRAMVEEHVGECEPCREMLDEMRQEVKPEAPKEQAERLVKKLRLRRLWRRALLVLLGMALSVLLAFAGWRGWNYYFNDFRVLADGDSYSFEVVVGGTYGTQTIMTILDGHAQVPNSYFDKKTNDLYLWSTTTRLPIPAKNVWEVSLSSSVYYFDDIGYGYMVTDYDWETKQWCYDAVPIKRIIKGAPTWYPNANTPGQMIYELADPSDETLAEKWRERLEETGAFNEWKERLESRNMEFVQEWENGL